MSRGDKIQAPMPKRPFPPENITQDTGIRFEPAPDLLGWARAKLIDDTAERSQVCMPTLARWFEAPNAAHVYLPNPSCAGIIFR